MAFITEGKKKMKKTLKLDIKKNSLIQKSEKYTFLLEGAQFPSLGRGGWVMRQSLSNLIYNKTSKNKQRNRAPSINLRNAIKWRNESISVSYSSNNHLLFLGCFQ